MTNDERIERLTELAFRAFDAVDDLLDPLDVTVDYYKGSTPDFTDAQVLVREDVRVSIESHPRALEALEAALLVLAGESNPAVEAGVNKLLARLGDPEHVPHWVEQLASEWDRLAANKHSIWSQCAAELRARAKGEP